MNELFQKPRCATATLRVSALATSVQVAIVAVSMPVRTAIARRMVLSPITGSAGCAQRARPRRLSATLNHRRYRPLKSLQPGLRPRSRSAPNSEKKALEIADCHRRKRRVARGERPQERHARAAVMLRHKPHYLRPTNS